MRRYSLQVRRFANVQSSGRTHSTRTSMRNTREEGEIQSKVGETFYLEGQNFDFKMIIRTRRRSSIYKRSGSLIPDPRALCFAN